MAQLKKRIDCSGHRSCVVVLEPSGEEFLLRGGQFLEIACETETNQSIEIDQHDNCYSVELPEGEVTLAVNGQPVVEPTPFSISDIVEVELAKLPGSDSKIDFSDEFVAFLQTVDFELDSIIPAKVEGKVQLFEIAAQTVMELARLPLGSAVRTRLIAAVCRRTLALGGVILDAAPDDYGHRLLSAADNDLHLGTEPISIRRLMASCCIYPRSILAEVARWGKKETTHPKSPGERTNVEGT